MSRIRTIILIVGIANLLFAAVSEVLGQLITGMAYATTIGRYRTLDSGMVINKDQVRVVLDDRMAGDWTLVADWLFRDSLLSVHRTSHVSIALLVVNALVLFLVWWMSGHVTTSKTEADKKSSG